MKHVVTKHSFVCFDFFCTVFTVAAFIACRRIPCFTLSMSTIHVPVSLIRFSGCSKSFPISARFQQIDEVKETVFVLGGHYACPYTLFCVLNSGVPLTLLKIGICLPLLTMEILQRETNSKSVPLHLCVC